MDFDEKTAIEQCRREISCIVATMERCITPDDNEDDRVLEHFMHALENVSDELDQIYGGHAADLVAPDWSPRLVNPDED